MTHLTSIRKSASGQPESRRLSLFQSPIGKKLLTGITGLGLVLFVIAHVLGNLLMFVSLEAFNAYAHLLEQLKPLMIAFEIALTVTLLLHAGLGIWLYLSRRNARPVGYETYQSAGQPSRQTLSSRSMIMTGLTLGGFLVWHLTNLKFGPWYITEQGGEPIRDLARLVIETFQRPLDTTLYIAVMIFLGFHLRHGIWSALQSLGALTKGMQVGAYSVGVVMSVAIAAGFIILPLAIFFGFIS
ncbi:MAG: succinate dehydrogenase cytochrome b subunit [Leptolyngbyaceae bacterium]|nr:succinate dehydrogenase cytochrome b subunit [Leptolyngbyaceae bacterium]